LARVATGQSLSQAEAEQAFDIIMSGAATPSQIGGFLMALRVRGETVDELTGAARIMRRKAIAIEAPPGAIDTCGTGGDAKGTLNVSTGASLVVAACGVPVAKHGNRALSSKTGAADVLAALGVKIDADFALVRESLWQNKLCFLMAPRHHTAMRNVAATRVELGTRTIFNLIGPLSNPAAVKRQLVGVFSRDWIEKLAAVLGQLGLERAWVVHGEDGLDEVTTTGTTFVAEWKDGRVRNFQRLHEGASRGLQAPRHEACADRLRPGRRWREGRGGAREQAHGRGHRVLPDPVSAGDGRERVRGEGPASGSKSRARHPAGELDGQGRSAGARDRAARGAASVDGDRGCGGRARAEFRRRG
jgi:anthranilate phosphoribosyltransferase